MVFVSFWLLLCIVVSFTVTLLLLPWWIRTAKKAGITGIDVHKINNPKVAEMGGITVLVGFLAGMFLYISVQTFIFHARYYNIFLFAGIMTIILAGIIGIIDDVLGRRIGLKQWQKPLLTLIASVPLVVVNAGTSTMNIPGIGEVHLGILYPLLVVPIIVAGSSNAFNMIAGYNGLEAGMGVIILSSLGFYAWLVQSSGAVALLAFVMVAALLAFLFYNWYPAKVFPGDTLTYSVGAAIAVVTILANMEKFAMILFIPYFVEFFLEARVGWRVWVFADVDEEGQLTVRHDKIISLETLFLKLGEKLRNFRLIRNLEVFTTVSFLVLELFFSLLAFLL